LQKTLVNRGPESNRQKSLAGKKSSKAGPKTPINKELKIQNVINMHLRFVMGLTPSVTLKCVIQPF
jgi:hypothetical protein